MENGMTNSGHHNVITTWRNSIVDLFVSKFMNE